MVGIITVFIVVDHICICSRSVGTIYSLYSFARKVGQALSSGLTGALLGLIGYTASTAFDPDVLNGIYNMGTIIPAIGFILLVIILLFWYPLSKKRVNENSATLAAKNEKK